MKKWQKIVFVVVSLLIGILLCAGLFLIPQPQVPVRQADLTLATLLNTDDTGFAEVKPGWPFRFPDDHSAHPDFRTETWYFNGSLQTSQKHSFGFQLTFFRLALTPHKPESDSAWASHQVYRAHFAISDERQDKFYAYERFSREALGLAGAEADPPAVWLENWRMQVTGDPTSPIFQLHVATEDTLMELKLSSRKPIITDVMASAENQPFHAYLLPRLQVEGRLSLQQESFTVNGSAWFDHAWGLVPMGRGQLALNRFVIQLQDQREILIFQLRRRDGSGQPLHSGLLIDSDGGVQELQRRDIQLEASTSNEWYSRRSGISYPLEWDLTLPAYHLTLTLSPLIEDQELNLSLRYWAGAMHISGETDGETVSGTGYVELTGYAP